MTAACDLEQDWVTRFVDSGRAPTTLLENVVLVDLYEAAQMRDVVDGESKRFNRDRWRQIQTRQQPRYHLLPEAPIGNDGAPVPEMLIDFKAVFSLPPTYLYEQMEDGTVQRLARTPDVHVHQVIQRFFAYQGRVGVPEA